MSSQVACSENDVSNKLLKELQSYWEIPAMAQYISLFRTCFNLPEIEIEELEKVLIEDTVNGPNVFLHNLLCAFLDAILAKRVTDSNWEDELRMLIVNKWCKTPFTQNKNPFDEGRPFNGLTIRSKVEILYCLCLFCLDRDDIQLMMKEMDADALRVQKLGSDEAGNAYWYFYGTRLYKDQAIEENSGSTQDVLDASTKSGCMNVSGESQWSVVCDTFEEWEAFADEFKESQYEMEKALFQRVHCNFLPALEQMYEEKEQKFQQRIRELTSVRKKTVTRWEERRFCKIERDVDNAAYSSSDMDNRAERIKQARGSYNVRMVPTPAKWESEISSENFDDTTEQPDETSDCTNSSVAMQARNAEKEVFIYEMEKVLRKVKYVTDAWPFLYPVDEDDAPGYYNIVKDPVDLSKIERSLHEGRYETVCDVDVDICKMVSNCKLYNGENHPYFKMAKTLKTLFQNEVTQLAASLKAHPRKLSDYSEVCVDSCSLISLSSTAPRAFPNDRFRCDFE